MIFTLARTLKALIHRLILSPRRSDHYLYDSAFSGVLMSYVLITYLNYARFLVPSRAISRVLAIGISADQLTIFQE